LQGGEIMYVGDHVESDVRATKSMFRWRTGLVLRELEDEFSCLREFNDRQAELSKMMMNKTELERQQAQLRIYAQRAECEYGPEAKVSISELRRRFDEVTKKISDLDTRIAPLAKEAGMLLNPRWGLLTRAGYDKSYLTRLLEGYADIYTSRVSNFLYQTPFAYLRSTRSSLPHDGGIVGGPHLGEAAE
jgi:hypothetical protein